MTETSRPETAEQVADAVQAAIVEGRPLELIGGGSKRAFGRPSEADMRLDLSALSGIVLYEPEELVLTARPGTAGRDRRGAGAAPSISRVRAGGPR